MKWFTGLALVVLPLLVEKAIASLNCTVINGPITYYTCPDDKCAVAGQYNVGQIAELGCAADSSPPAPNRWFYNWNGYYTKQQPNNYANCKLGNMNFPSVDVLPLCRDDPYVPTPPPCVCNPTTGLPGVSTSTSPVVTRTTTPVQPQPTVVPGGNIQKYAQCGGQGWTGSGTCVSGSTCRKLNDWYHQCL